MKSFLIFDGRSTESISHQRYDRLSQLIRKLVPQSSIDIVEHKDKLKERLQNPEPRVCCVHHSELVFNGWQAKDLPDHHFYIHYSGAGFTDIPEGWADGDHRLFYHESVDVQQELTFKALEALIQVLAHIEPPPPVGQWNPQLKTLALTPYLSTQGHLLGNFPLWLKESWEFQIDLTQPDRSSFQRWAAEQTLPDGSTPAPLTVEMAYRCFQPNPSVASTPKRSVPFADEQKLARLRHDMKYLLFALKDNRSDDFVQQWKGEFRPLFHEISTKSTDLSQVLKHVDAYVALENPSVDDGLVRLKELRQALSKLSFQSSDMHEEASTPPPSEGASRENVERDGDQRGNGQKQHQHGERDVSNSNRQKQRHWSSYECFKHAPSQQTPRLWSVGPRFSERLSQQIDSKTSNACARAQRCHDAFSHLNDLLHHLRQVHPTELYHTLLIVDVGSHLREALNAGHKSRSLSAASSWTHDHDHQMGILSRLLITFPHLQVCVLHDLSPTECKDVLRKEWFYACPNGVVDEDAFLDQLISHHFSGSKDQDQSRLLNIAERFIEGQRMIFDPTGMRTLVKCRLIANIFSSTTDAGEPDLSQTEEQRKVIASRLEKVLVSIDEDVNSTLFHAYAGYRFGFRSWTITTFKQFDQKNIWRSSAKHHLVIRDTDLRFPDIDGREPLRDKRPQGNVRQRLESVHSDLWRWLPKDEHGEQVSKLEQHWTIRAVTSETQNLRLKPWVGCSEDESRLGEIEGSSEDHHILGLPKPLTSLYDLSKLMTWEGDPKLTVASRLTPPDRLTGSSGHYTPYINLPIASELLSQAQQCQGENELEWLIGAVLASEADELLLGMSEYTGLDAVRWLHRSEVRAEIRSVGFSGLIDINERKNELVHLVKSRYVDNLLSQDHFLSRLWDDLRTLYKSAEQFHAAEQANIESFCKRKWLGHRQWAHHLEEWTRRGIILCASSLKVWASCLLVSTAALWACYHVILPDGLMDSSTLVFSIFMSSLIGEPVMGFDVISQGHKSLGLQGLLFVHFSVSYVLFGFFLSMVYRRITRS